MELDPDIIPDQVVAAVCREVEQYSAEQVRDVVNNAAASQTTAFAFARPFLEVMRLTPWSAAMNVSAGRRTPN
jgi:hypothetical protein